MANHRKASAMKTQIKRFSSLINLICILATITLTSCGQSATPVFHKPQFSYTGNAGGKSVIYTLYADGTGFAALTDGSSNDSGPLWSPDGEKVAFTSDRDGTSEIYLMNPDGSQQIRVTNTQGNKSGLTWSPDGKQLVFAETKSGINNVYAVNVDGSDLVQLATQAEDVYMITWSPNHQWLAFNQASPNGRAVVIVRRDGSDLQMLASDLVIRSFCFSPDSRLLVYSAANPAVGIDDQIYSINLDGSSLTQLTNSAGRNMVNFWLPDRKHIAFSSDRDGTVQLYQMNPDGSDQTKLTQNSAGVLPVGLSPNGKWIAVISDQGGYRELFIVSIDGSNQKQITSLKQVISQAWWSPDGQYFSISSNLDQNYDPENWRTWVVSLDGSIQMDITTSAGNSLVAWRP
jgi:Tol biopolymer transport system component